MKVVIDSREKDRVKSASEYYTKQGVEVEVSELPIGDYLFDDQVVFEFKTIPDFISSIQSGRVFNQAINQAEEYDYHYVLIYGDGATRAKYIAISKSYNPVTHYQYLGAIASLNKYTSVIESYNPAINEAFYRMMVQANKCLQTKPIVKKFPRKHKNPAYNYLCYCVYGLNSKRANEIVKAYNLESMNDLMRLTKEDLINIKGIGDKTADNIMNSLK